MRRALACVALLAIASSAVAQPAPDPRRRVAVLSFRQDTGALGDIAERVTGLLAQKTSLAVVSADAARGSYGPAFDADLVRCAGKPSCLTRIGRALGVAEVLLVGVSEFGDVILTLQRIDAGSGRITGRIAEALDARARPSDRALLGYLARVLPPGDFRRFGVLRVVADQSGASVDIGGARRGVTPLPPLRLAAPASYDILVRKPGFVEFRASVAVPPDAEVVVRPFLDRRADRAWYQRWWVAAIAGTLVVGAVATAVVATQGDDDVPVHIEPF